LSVRVVEGLCHHGRLRDGNPDPSHPVWWLHPAVVPVSLVAASTIAAIQITAATYLEEWRTARLVDGDLVARVGLSLAAFGIAVVISASRPATAPAGWPALSDAVRDRVRPLLTASWYLTLFGYVTLLGAGISRGFRLGDIAALLSGATTESASLKRVFSPVSGVTSFTQAGIAYVILATVVDPEDRRTRRRVLIVIALGVARALLVSERLAVYELLVPTAVIIAFRQACSGDARHRALVRLAPLIAVPVLIVTFAGFEFTRSWSFYSEHSEHSVLEFAELRLLGYYVTALNNAALVERHDDDLGGLPYATVEGLWEVPILDRWVNYESVTGVDRGAVYRDLLQQEANPEFNNAGGITAPTSDFGLAGGILVLAATGVVMGLLYRSFTRGDLVGLFGYPLAFVGLVDLPRIWYFGQGRILPAVALLAAAALRARAPDRDRAITADP
jgi:hypothetical protein